MEEQDEKSQACRVERCMTSFNRSLAVSCCAALLVLFVAFVVIYNATGHTSHNGADQGRILEEQTQVPHKSLFPLSTRDFIGFALATCGLTIAAGGGIGGGGILVPIYILVLQFPAKHAIPLSNVTVLGGAVANTLLNVRKRHPLADRPLIDWTIIMVMEPLTILGSLFGAHLNKLLPESVIVVLLVILLSLTAYKTLAKARKLYEKETMGWTQVDHQDQDTRDDDDNGLELVETATRLPVLPRPVTLSRRFSDSVQYVERSFRRPSGFQRSTSFPVSVLQRAISESPIGTLEATKSTTSSFDLDVQACTNSIEDIQNDDARNPTLALILQEERFTPINIVCCIMTLFLFVLLVNILKGGGAFHSPLGIECGSLSFWIAEATIAFVICLFSWMARASLLRRTRLKRECCYQYLECDIEWNEMSTIVYPLLSCTAGFVAGLFGIGGGIIKGPLMLALGIAPAVASATSACMILFTSFTATTSFVVFGLLIKDYGIFCLMNGFVSTLVGQTIMSLILKRRQGNSSWPIAACIGAVVLLSAICMTVESIISMTAGQAGGSGRASGLCSSSLE